eukprot:Gregarina_sp_Poly_1__794@NODE_118_length_13642_cov_140_527956_g105_i0_p5_GENE_NODE_118_length_13642_cov_140_527956_g105_i0NODE_118_length_13642_cov_140_527956_g105_i0_p5_ORF_typecomplete_len211_score19_14_NODE_118_length_13642_cov_140_527956_g105_i01296513597
MSLPYRMSEYPMGVLVEAAADAGYSQLYCILEPQHLDSLLNNSRVTGVDSFTVRDCITSSKGEFDSAAIMVTRAVAPAEPAAVSYFGCTKSPIPQLPPSPISSPSRTPPPLTRFSARSTPVHATKKGTSVKAAPEDLSTTGIPSHVHNVSSAGDEGQNENSPWTPICKTPSLRNQESARGGINVNERSNESNRASPPSRILWPAKSLGQV